MEEKKHPGITMHNIGFGGGFEGLLFTVGTALIFLFGLPALWYFVAFSAGLGLLVAIIFRLIGKHRSDRAKPLSIIQTAGQPEGSPDPAKNTQHRLLGLQPAPDAA
jgi:hypothetical protein